MSTTGTPFPNITQTDLKDPQLFKLNNNLLLLWNKLSSLYSAGNVTINATITAPLMYLTGESQPPTNNNAVLTLGAADQLFSPSATRTKLLYGSSKNQPLPAPSTGGSTPTPPGTPGNATILEAIATLVTNTSDSTYQIQTTVIYTPPSPIGTFTGVWVYVDMPDSSVGLAIADGTQPADGTTAAVGVFNPTLVKFFPYLANNLQFSFSEPAPAAAQLWRVYLVSSSQQLQLNPVENGQPGASPNKQYYVPAGNPATAASGREHAPLVLDVQMAPTPTGWTANPNVFQVDAGDQDFEFAVTWQWPTTDPTINTLGGINLVLYDGKTQKYLGNIAYIPSVTEYSSPPFSVLPGTTEYTLFIISYSTTAQNNSLVAGVTPNAMFQVSRNMGEVGAEYTSLVTAYPGKALVSAPAVTDAADGTADLDVLAWFKAPTLISGTQDPSWGGAEVDVLKTDGNYYLVTKGVLAPVEAFISNPASVQSWAFFVRSIDINGRYNTIAPQLQFGGPGTGAVVVPVVTSGVITSYHILNGGTGYTSAPTVTIVGSGTGAVITANVGGGAVTSLTITNGGTGFIATPMVVISVGSALGLLNLAQAVNTSFSSQFAIIGSVFQVQTLSASLIKTGQLQVGGGTGQVPEVKVFDATGLSLIAWMGSDAGSPGLVGIWGKQMYVGGASPASAPIVADSAGNVTINGATFTFTNSTVITEIANTSYAGLILGLTCADSTFPASTTLQTAIYDGGLAIWYGTGVSGLLPNVTLNMTTGGNPALAMISSGGTIAEFSPSQVIIGNLPTTNPGSGSKQLWADPSDSYRVKYAF